MSTPQKHSAFYEGFLGHRRHRPKFHDFSYRVCMCYIDLDEWADLKKQSFFWSDKRFSMARFVRQDFLDGASTDLKAAVIDKVQSLTGLGGIASVRMLTNLRYFGFIMNPLTIYYCFDENEVLRYLLLEVTNTPWKERHYYAVVCHVETEKGLVNSQTTIEKKFHVSPFNPMDQYYRWDSSLPSETLLVEMLSYDMGTERKQSVDNNRDYDVHDKCEKDDPVFQAKLKLERKPMTGKTMNGFILRYPLMTLKVCAAIYWQAAKLFFKGVKFYGHPKTVKVSTTGS